MFRRLAVAALGSAALLSACAPQQQVTYVPVQAVCDTRFRVVNNSSVTVARFQFSHVSRNDWGVDQLGSSVLPPGRAMTFTAANAGGYDFRVTWANGQTSELRNIDICRASQITVTNRGLFAS